MTKSKELYGIQYLRAIAALAVVLHHTLEISSGSIGGPFSPDWLTTAGASGVDIFFVISGFIMVYISFPFNKKIETPKKFLLKRIIRIFPLYWICSLFIFFIIMIGFLKSIRIDYITIINSIFLIPGRKLIGISWTLSYEMYFYLAFSFALIAGKRLFSSFFTIWILICFIFIGKEFDEFEVARFMANPIVLEFCFGVCLALLFLRKPKWMLPPIYCIPAFLVIFSSPIFIPHSSTNGLPDLSRVIAWGLPAILLVAAFIAITPPKTAAGRFFLLLGDASYATYLTHPFVMIAYGWLIKRTIIGEQNQFVFIVFFFSVCVAAGVFSHLVVELPMLKFIRNLTNGRMSVSSQTAA